MSILAFLLGACTLQSNREMENAYPAAIEAVGAESTDFWVRVHAIEFLIDLGHRDQARRLIEQCRVYEDSVPQRIGYWRMMYRVSEGTGRQSWLQKIKEAYLDSTGHDRIHAAETLAKLDFSLASQDRGITARDLNDPGALGAYVNWGMALRENAEPDYEQILAALEDTSAVRKRVAAYALTFMKPLPAAYAQRLFHIAIKEPAGSGALPYLLHAAFIQNDDSVVTPDREALNRRLYDLAGLPGKDGPISFCKAVAAKGDRGAEAVLKKIYSEPVSPTEPGLSGVAKAAHDDIRVAAAFALASIFSK